MFEKGQKEEAMLYYLYMMADGEVSYSEEKLFAEICKEMKIDEYDKQVVIDGCNEITKESTDILNVIIRENLDYQVGQGWSGFKDASALARIIWNLVNLGYADSDYSESERKIVKHLLEKWGVKQEIYLEMVDTADTMLALTKQKEWIYSTFDKGQLRDEKEKRIDLEFERMLSEIMITIDELTMW